MKRTLVGSICISLVCLMTVSTNAQNLTKPMPSQKAIVQQTIGITEVKVIYHRPAVKDRVIWGDLVPYREVWRTGANENTTVWFSDDVEVEGRELNAGLYGFHMIPGKEEWTVIFSNNSSSWGSYDYNSEEDALRVMVKPIVIPHQEHLQFSFDKLSNEGAVLVLAWEKLAIPIDISVDTRELVFANMKNELRSLPGFTWMGWNSIANYCLENDMYIDEAINFCDRSLKHQRNFTNLNTRARLAEKTGDSEMAAKFAAEAVERATNVELNMYGYQLLNDGNFEDALSIFKLNTERNPTDPNVWDSLAEGYATAGDKSKAIKYFKKSLSMDPPENVSANSIKYLKKYGIDTSQYEKELSKR